MLLEQKPGECCRECKGCFHNGFYYASDTEWRDPQDPCTVHHCKAGLITTSKEVCFDSHCMHVLPLIPGKCCAPCKGERQQKLICGEKRCDLCSSEN